MSQVNPNARAFPSGEQWTDIAGNSNGKSPIHPGLTVRAYFAGLAMQGFCANPAVFAPNAQCGWSLVNCTEEQLADCCAGMADALIAELNKPTNTTKSL